MTKLKLTNSADLYLADSGQIPRDRVRSVVLDALVDTGAMIMVIPEDAARALGLPVRGRNRIRVADGRVVELDRVGGMVAEILGRETDCDALVSPAGSTPLISQIQLEALDLVVDPRSRDVRANPASPDGPLLEVLRVA